MTGPLFYSNVVRMKGANIRPPQWLSLRQSIEPSGDIGGGGGNGPIGEKLVARRIVSNFMGKAS